MPNYQKTKRACYLGLITQAIAANFAPLLFLTFHKSYVIPLGKIALISSVFFITQLIVDILCAHFADVIGYRKCVVGSQLLSAVGLVGLAFLPQVTTDPFTGIIISTILYAIGSGLTEVLVNPIVEACPFEHKESAMSLLHSFYCWGAVGVILLSTLFFSLFWLAILLMICAGASELSMAQWASAFAESALGLSKSMGDIAGPCMFAVTMGISRSLYGKYGEKLDLMKFMIGSGALCLACYITASLSEIPLLGLVGCIVCGFSVGIMWPRNYKHLFGKDTIGRYGHVCTSGNGRRYGRCTRTCSCGQYFPKCRR